MVVCKGYYHSHQEVLYLYYITMKWLQWFQKWNKLPQKHWMYRTRFYNTWQGINNRCSKNYYRYCDYGWRWIKVCDEWSKFEWFHRDMYESYLEHVCQYWEYQTTIDRKNNDWNYELSNCRRATRKEQNYNKRNNRKIMINWEEKNLFERLKTYWRKAGTYYTRLECWWNVIDAIVKPLKK